jgi:hypothetical protein
MNVFMCVRVYVFTLCKSPIGQAVKGVVDIPMMLVDPQTYKLPVDTILSSALGRYRNVNT